MDPKGKGIVIGDKEEIVNNNKPKGDKPIDSDSNNKKDMKKRRIKKIVYYDSDASSTSPKDDDDSCSKKKTVNQTTLLIVFAFCTTPMLIYYLFLLASPLTLMGNIIFWSYKMCSHLFSLHPSIWEVVENGMPFDINDNSIFIHEQIHKFSQATTVLLASLCKDEYNRVSGLDNAREKYGTPSKLLMRKMTPQ
jgi:hypothetical protein